MTYKIRKDGAVLKFNDDESVSVLSPDPTNHMTAAYLAWVAAGNQADRLETIEQRRADRVKQLADYTDSRVLSEVELDGNWYQCDLLNRSRVMSLDDMTEAQILFLNQKWRCLNGTRPPITKALVSALRDKIKMHEMICLGVSDQHRDWVEASDDPENYDFTTGWPARYEAQS